MSEEEKEAIKHFKNYENKLVYEINEKDKKYAKTLLNLIEKLQKENTELKEENIILEGNKIGLKLAIQELKEKLDYYSYYKEKESQEFDERDYYEE